MDKIDNIPQITYDSPQLRKAGMDILDLETFVQDICDQGANPYQPHRVSHFCLIFVEQGEGQHPIDFHSYPYESGCVIFLNKYQIHTFNRDNKIKGTLVLMTREFFAAGAANIRTSYFVPAHQTLSAFPILPLSDDLNESTRAMLSEMTRAIKEGPDSGVIVQLLLSAMLLKLTKLRQGHLAHLSEQQKARYGEFLRLVDEQFTEVREASQYAQMMHSSYKYLNQLCKTCCGHTAKQLIDFRIILEIKRKLTMDGLSVQDTAFEVGFEDITHFIKYFKRHTGKTPAAFKREQGD
ncbi:MULTISPECIES: AraC family transcriptional regulator [Ferrimonas]|uniref:AraC family transcriptional regulator n=1 Tax=Ferrimonas TaxID=44011 RepID=UPI00040C7470|nr:MULTISPECIES: helix-turn-helix domain-containing protein [Ferrimonas]USD38131.1 AraC family transcriptional regulator [Ferrimonas sp. SCSIO 43195]